MPQNLLKDRSAKPPFVEPYLRALDRIQDDKAMGHQELTSRATALLQEISGAGEVPAVTSFAYGPTGIIGSHTHYFDGFAVLLSLPLGTAVAARAGKGGASEVAFEGSDAVWQFSLLRDDEPSGDHPVWIRVVEDILRAFAPGLDAIRIAISTTIFPQCLDAYVAALGAAVSEVAIRLSEVPVSEHERVRVVREIIERQTGMPFGATYLIAAIHGHTARYILADGLTYEHLPLEAPSQNEIGWGIMHVEGEEQPPPSDFHMKKEWIDEALVHLQQKAFPQLSSFRELEHRDLHRALGALPGRFKPGVRHLVTENRRVQKAVAALRKSDWQFVGALLMMSHASRHNDWKSTTPAADLIVEHAESMSIEGMFGACQTSRGGSVLVCGQPFVVPQFFERLSEPFRERFGIVPTTMLLQDSDAGHVSSGE